MCATRCAYPSRLSALPPLKRPSDLSGRVLVTLNHMKSIDVLQQSNGLQISMGTFPYHRRMLSIQDIAGKPEDDNKPHQKMIRANIIKCSSQMYYKTAKQENKVL
ncbi:hypothetical protein NDU88_004964 [Pleurodeles waltl]|uniref:Uncharacterized protein n=1 Tax=Pleurodeles waltl TaxID=8319 RepID=A0AAV7LN84_PLEWA|nr:hypothetical protein NDU88_004964 [Pleurodeles waltl]